MSNAVLRPTTQLSRQDAYIQTLYAPQSEAMRQVYAEGEKRRPGMQISAYEGKLLQLLATIIHAERILEVGTFMGYSTLWMAQALPKNGHIVTLEKDPEHAHLARGHAMLCGYGDRIEVREGDGIALLKMLKPDEKFDMVFFDAEKSQYPDYLELTLPHLRQGGLVVADNTLLWNNVYLDAPSGDVTRASWEGMRRFNELLADDSRFTSLLIATPEGMSVAVKK